MIRIHREGKTFLFVLLIILAGLVLTLEFLLNIPPGFLNIILLACIGLYVFFLQFFRDPLIKINPSDKFLLAPADGKIVIIQETEEPEYFGDSRLQVSIFMSPFNVHINRSPVQGQVSYFRYHRGKYLVAWHPKSSVLNERTSVVIKTTNGLEILVRQIAGIVARRIKYYIKEGDYLEQGQEFGFIKFGSRVDLFLPPGTRITAAVGDKVTAGLTPIAELN